MIAIMGKNRDFRNRPQQGQSNNQSKVEQPKTANAPLANVADSAPVVEYCSEAELASLLNLLEKMEESASMFGDVATEAVQSVVAPIRSMIVTTGAISPEDQAQIEKLKEEIREIEQNVGARSPFPTVANTALKTLEESADPIAAKWRENQELIGAFGGEETSQMTAADYKDAINTLGFYQVMAFVFSPVDMEGCPEALVNIDQEFNAAFEEESEIETEEPQTQPAIAAV